MLDTVVDYIARTNLFNFVIFASIIAYIFVKLDVIGLLNKGKTDVAQTVEASETAKIDSQKHLEEIEEQLKGLNAEIESIFATTKNNAVLVGEKILTEAEESTEIIKENAVKVIENKSQLVRNDLLKRLSIASVETAKNHIISELNNNAELHDKLINESIEALNEIEEAGGVG